jgi:hypothetical protein
LRAIDDLRPGRIGLPSRRCAGGKLAPQEGGIRILETEEKTSIKGRLVEFAARHSFADIDLGHGLPFGAR